MLLVVVLIVAFLAKDALLKYLGPAATTTQKAAPRTQLDPASTDASAPAPANAMEAAKSLQGMMQKESEKRGGDQ